MKKLIQLDCISLLLYRALIGILFSSGIQVDIYAQCSIAQETNASPTTPTSCNNATVKLGAGASYLLPIKANTYYDFSFAGNVITDGYCLTPANGNASPYSGTNPINNWFSGNTTSLTVSASRVLSSPPGSWTTNSSVLTYRYSLPKIRNSASATPDTLYVGDTLILNADTASNSYYGIWTAPKGSGIDSIIIDNVNTSAKASINGIPKTGTGCYNLLIVNPIGGCEAIIISTNPVTVLAKKKVRKPLGKKKG